MQVLRAMKVLAALICAAAFVGDSAAGQIRLQARDDLPTSFTSDLSNLKLDPARQQEIENSVELREYKRAETILLEEAEQQPKSARAAKALTLAGGIFFLDGQYLSSAIAWKKAEALGPLDDRSRFTLAMAYIKLNHPDWARPELGKLAAAHPQNALYLYWLGRLDYDARNYAAAIVHLQRVLEIDPKMTRGYDTLGLCYDYLGQFEEAVKSYNRAIELNRLQPKPSPWPHLDLAISLISLNRLSEAEQSLREALGYDAQLPQAHYQLGRVLEMRGELEAAVPELNQAATLKADYPEPHLLLGRIFNRLHQTEKAKAEIAIFQQLNKATRSDSLAKPEPSPARE